MERELAIALRARVTWLVAAISALLVGHSFVLAIDLYSASSRSAFASLLQTREMDPLAGVVRPTLGGVGLAIALLAPLIAARPLAIEKERRSYGALCLAAGSTTRVIVQKSLAGLLAGAPLLISPALLFALFRAAGGHIDPIETAVALGGEGLHLLLVTVISVAAAAWTQSFAQAVTVGVLASLTSWAIDASEGFAALAWLGGAADWSIERYLLPFQRGVVSLRAVGWLLGASASAFVLALVGGSFVNPKRKLVLASGIVWVSLLTLIGLAQVHRGFDWSEQRRASLPPAIVNGLRAIADPIQLDVTLDRDDSRRRQLEADTLAKLRLARPDLQIFMPLDDARDVTEAARDPEYGRIRVQVGSESRETRSTSRRELVTLIFEASGRSLPAWEQPVYPGFPTVIEGAPRRNVLAFSYLGLPSGFLFLGWLLTRKRGKR
ncbi:MAG: hypothetical protein ACOY0T_21500 [Myxococcota bacterium]